MKILIRISFVLIFFISNLIYLYPQQQEYNDTSRVPVQYRRGTEIPSGYQTYEQKYLGKDLRDEKRRLYPLDKITSGTGIWTELNPGVPRVTYTGINFVNKDTGWACGDLGTIIKTTDGGESWSVIETNTTTPILKIRSYNGQVVIATGYDGLILRSTDGGEIFVQVPSGLGSGFDLWGLDLVNDTLGWACGATALLKTTDAGQNWQIVNIPGYIGNFWWIEFMNENYGFIAADGKVLRTIDGGDNWEIIQAGDSQSLYCIDVIDSLHIAAAGYGGTSYPAKNLYSSDGGYTWINGGNLTTEDVNCIQYVNPDTGYLVMSGVSARKTTNRGQEWTTIQGISDNYEIKLLNNNVGYSAGTKVKISRAEGDLDVWHRLFINDNFSDVFFVNEQKGFVISGAAYSDYRGLYKTTDGGINWQYVSGAPDGVDLLFIDSLTGFISTSDCKIYKTTNGGSNWYMMNLYGLADTLGSISKIYFINTMIGWACTDRGGILKTTDRGENWFTQMNAGVYAAFNGLFFLDSLSGWAVWPGYNGIYCTTNGGEIWVQRVDIQIYQAYDIYFTNANMGWIANGQNGGLYKTTDGGILWSIVPEVIDPINFNFFPDPLHWIINGSHRYITTNSGSSWIDITNDVPTGFTRFQAPTNLLGYAVGDHGLILKYVDTVYTPVELTNFSIALDGQNVVLKWITATETNNKGYEVQRKIDGSYWHPVGFVEGNGTSSIHHSYLYVDKKVSTGKYYYRLKQIDFNGRFEYSKEIYVAVIKPTKFSLEQNYPNPFNPTTRISFIIPTASRVLLTVFDVLGREVTTLINKTMIAGYYNMEFNASELASGIYYYRLKTEGNNGEFFDSIKKMVLIR